MSKLESGLFNVIRGCYDSNGNRYKELETVFISEFNHGEGYILGEDAWIEMKNLSRAETKVISVSKYRELLFKKCDYDYLNYVPEGDISFSFNDLRMFLREYNDLISPDELLINLTKYSKQYKDIMESVVDDPFAEKETTVCYAFLKYYDQMIKLFDEDFEALTKKSLDDALAHMNDIYDASSYPYPLLMHLLEIFDHESNLSKIKDDKKKIDLYFNLLNVGIDQNIRAAINEAAYNYYCGTPISDRDIDKAEPLLRRLADEYNDEFAMNTLGYIYYYYRGNVKDHYRIAYSYFSVASLAGVTEATYKCADIFEKGLIGSKNPKLSHKLIMDCYSGCVDGFFSGNLVAKFPDLCLRIGMHYKDGIGVQKDEAIARAYLLCAKSALELRMEELNYIGDDSVANRISKELDSLGNINKEIVKMFPGSLLNDGLNVFYNYHETYRDIDCESVIIDKNTLSIALSSNLYNYFIFPDLINDKATITNKLIFNIQCSDAASLKKDIKRDSIIHFRDSTSNPELIVTNKKGETCYVIRSFSLISNEIN